MTRQDVQIMSTVRRLLAPPVKRGDEDWEWWFVRDGLEVER